MTWPPQTHQDVEDRIDNAVSARPWRRRPGRYYGAAHPYQYYNSYAIPANVIEFTPFPVDTQARLDRIAISVWTQGQVGGIVRLGVYDDDGGLAPLNPLCDVTVSSASTGTQEATIDVPLDPGMYWLAALTADTTARFRGYNQSAVSERAELFNFGHTAADTPVTAGTYVLASSQDPANALPTGPHTGFANGARDLLVVTVRAATP